VAFKTVISGLLYKAIASGNISFHDALRIYRIFDLYISRSRSPSARFTQKKVLGHLIEATHPQARCAWTSVLFPAEILHPFNIYPMTLEVVAGIFSTVGLSQVFLNLAEGMDVPKTMCSFHRALIGISGSGFIGEPFAVGATSLMCDGNVKSFAHVAGEQRAPFFFIDVPFEAGDESVGYVRGQLEAVLRELSQLTGVRDYEAGLAESVKNANQTFSLMRRFYSLRKESGKNLFCGHETANLAFPMHFMLGSPNLVKIIRARCEDVENGGRHNRFFKSLYTNAQARRIMWLHIVPQYDTPLWTIIDNGCAAKVVCDEYSNQFYGDYDPTDPLGSIAKRLICHPSNGPIERRIEHILDVARDFRVDGIVHYSSWGCHQAAGNVHLLRQKIEEAGFAFLNLDGDAVDRRNQGEGQMRTRAEAFLEGIRPSREVARSRDREIVRS